TPKGPVAGLVAPLAAPPEPRALAPARRPDAPLWSAYLQPPPASSIDPEAIAIDEHEDGMAVLVARTRAARVYAAAKMLARTAKAALRHAGPPPVPRGPAAPPRR